MRLLIAVLGLAAGSAVTLAGLLFNPLSPGAMTGGDGNAAYDWTPLEFHGVELNAVSLLGLPLRPAGKPLVSQSLGTANIAVIVLRNSVGEAAGLATRISALDKQSDLLSADLGVSTYTNVFMPNRGSLFLVGQENRWPVVRSNVMSALGQPAVAQWAVTTRLRDGSPSSVVGSSGELETLSGRYVERLQPGNADNGVFSGQIELALGFK